MIMFFVALLVADTAGQSQNATAGGPDIVERSIRQKVKAGQMDGMEIIIYEVKGETLIPVRDPSRIFKDGDLLRIEFTSSIEGYVYFVNISPDGKRAVIFPDTGETNRIIKGKTYRLPEDTDLEFTGEQKGDEIIQVIMTSERIAFFDDAIKKSGGELDADSASAAAELVSMAGKKKSGIDSEPIAKVLPTNNSGEVLSRGLRLKTQVLAPKEKDEKGTVIAIPDGLKDGGIAVIEILIRHR
jgi:hypothetical protein